MFTSKYTSGTEEKSHNIKTNRRTPHMHKQMYAMLGFFIMRKEWAELS